MRKDADFRLFSADSPDSPDSVPRSRQNRVLQQNRDGSLNLVSRARRLNSIRVSICSWKRAWSSCTEKCALICYVTELLASAGHRLPHRRGCGFSSRSQLPCCWISGENAGYIRRIFHLHPSLWKRWSFTLCSGLCNFNDPSFPRRRSIS